jgi:hypothetical protein
MGRDFCRAIDGLLQRDFSRRGNRRANNRRLHSLYCRAVNHRRMELIDFGNA